MSGMSRPKRAAASNVKYVDDNVEEEEELEFIERPQRGKKAKADDMNSNEGDNVDEGEIEVTKSRRTKRTKALHVVKDDDDEDEDSMNIVEDEDVSVVKKEKGNRRAKASSATYAEASSDDEFARDNFILASDDDDDDDDANSNKNDDDMEYRIQYILGRKSATPAEWRTICDSMETNEISRGSVLKQPDSEYFDTSDNLIEKYLIKWSHASFLHLSWETEKDLIELVGSNVKSQFKKLQKRELKRQDLFEDLSAGEYFSPAFIQVERIVGIDDDSIDIESVDWQNGIIPVQSNDSPVTPVVEDPVTETAETAETVDAVNETSIADSEAVVRPRRNRRSIKKIDETIKKKDKKRVKSANNILHGSDARLLIKWESLSYTEVTYEHVTDLAKLGVEYETALRSFYRREQSIPATSGSKKIKRSLDSSFMEQPIAPPFLGGTLRDYQWEGVRWLLFNWSQKRNSILADEMGLGKTIQSATFLQTLKSQQGLRGPFLIIVPLSTLVNWKREISTWTDMDVVVYHGSQEDRELIREYEFKYHDNTKNGHKLEVVVATPETCMTADNSKLKKDLAKICWDLIIIDEAHKIKNYDSKLSICLRDEFDYRNCLLLTGTPLQNNTDELWALLNFVDRDEFHSRDEFVSKFGNLQTSKQLGTHSLTHSLIYLLTHSLIDDLHTQLKPYLLRREKDNVENTIPPKEEIIIEVELTIPQKQYYRAIYEQKTGFLYKGERGAKDGPSLSNLAMLLRLCCNHPFLIKGAEKEMIKHFTNETAMEILIKSSGKMTLLDKLLPKLYADGHRVLIFSQFRMVLDIIEDYMTVKGIGYERVDGTITGKKRQSAIDRYTEKGIFAMLLSTRAGGVGINLTAADTVIIYDSDWNPQNDIQAQARAHRIGQTRPVKVYRLLTRNTYEGAMFRAASMKLGLDYAVMHNMRGNTSMEGINSERADHVSALSKKEQEYLLKHGAYSIFHGTKEGDEEESTKFCEANIDQILQRSAVVVHTGDKSKVTSCGSNQNFSKASFVSSSNDHVNNNISIDDPEFWNKVVGLAVANDEIEGSRKRKCRTYEISYKEPGMSEYLLKNDEKRKKNDSDSDDDDDSDVTAIWNEINLNKIQTSMVSKGYCQWNPLRNDAKLRWSHHDVSKGCRYMLLQLLIQISLNNSVVVDVSNETGGGNVGSTSHVAIDSEELENNIRKFKCFRLALTVANSDVIPIHVDAAANTSMDVAVENAPVTSEYALLLESLQRHAVTTSEESNHIPNIQYFDIGNDIDSGRAIYIMKQIGLQTESFPAETLPKSKQTAFAKVRQIEDLFELFLAAAHIHKGAEWNETSVLPVASEANGVESMINGTESMVNESIIPVAGTHVLMSYLQASSAVEDHQTDELEESVVDKPISLTTDFDILLITAVVMHGWPDGKRKISSIMEYFDQHGKLDAFKQANMDDPKVIVKHTKNLVIKLRGEKKEVSKSSGISEASKLKKSINAVIRTMQRIGRPRAMYEAMMSHVVVLEGDNILKSRNYLLSIEEFMVEVNCPDLSVEKCQEIIAAIVDTHSNSNAKSSGDGEKVVTDGLLSGISLKQIDLCHEKCDILHRLRLAITCNEENRILQFIQRNCKGTGPDAHPSRRDITMPVWWTKHHDLHLLRLVLEQGLGQWKSLAVNPVVSSSLPNFVMPTRVQGVDWSLALTAKNVEKRFTDLYKTLQNSIPIEQLPPGSPSDTLTKAKAAKPFFPVSSSKPSQPSQSSQPSQPSQSSQPSQPSQSSQPVMVTPFEKVSSVPFDATNVIDLISQSVTTSPVATTSSSNQSDNSVITTTVNSKEAGSSPINQCQENEQVKVDVVVAPPSVPVVSVIVENTPARDNASVNTQQISPVDVITMATTPSVPPDAKENSKPVKSSNAKPASASTTSKKKAVPAVPSGNIMSFFSKVPKPSSETVPAPTTETC